MHVVVRVGVYHNNASVVAEDDDGLAKEWLQLH